MSDEQNTIQGAWALASRPAAGGAGRTERDVADWQELVGRVATVAIGNAWSKAEVSRRSGVPEGTFSQWFSGIYKGRFDQTNTRIRQWLDSVAEAEAMGSGIPDSPPYFETRTSAEIVKALLHAQNLPELSVITIGAGIGKTITCEHYRNTRPHVFMATMSPNTRTVHGMLTEIAASLGIVQHNPAKLHRSIGERLQRNGRKTLLIIDEAQNLSDQAVDQARSLLDINKCGIALIGNEEIYSRFGGEKGGPSYAQIKRRIGRRLKRLTPYPEDITAQIDAWGVTDAGARNLLAGIGNKPGALGNIDKTMKLASLLAAGLRETVSEKHIRAAWQNRAVEE